MSKSQKKYRRLQKSLKRRNKKTRFIGGMYASFKAQQPPGRSKFRVDGRNTSSQTTTSKERETKEDDVGTTLIRRTPSSYFLLPDIYTSDITDDSEIPINDNVLTFLATSIPNSAIIPINKDLKFSTDEKSIISNLLRKLGCKLDANGIVVDPIPELLNEKLAILQVNILMMMMMHHRKEIVSVSDMIPYNTTTTPKTRSANILRILNNTNPLRQQYMQQTTKSNEFYELKILGLGVVLTILNRTVVCINTFHTLISQDERFVPPSHPFSSVYCIIPWWEHVMTPHILDKYNKTPLSYVFDQFWHVLLIFAISIAIRQVVHRAPDKKYTDWFNAKAKEVETAIKEIGSTSSSSNVAEKALVAHMGELQGAGESDFLALVGMSLMMRRFFPKINIEFPKMIYGVERDIESVLDGVVTKSQEYKLSPPSSSSS